MKIVAFMQNMWVKNPERVKASIERYPSSHRERYRLKLIQYSLFAGCLSGRRLKAALGEELCQQIIWEESTREIAGDSKKTYPPDMEHIKAVLATHQPDVVITFGAIATKAVASVWTGKFIHSHHPASRNPESRHSLQRAADELKLMVKCAGR